MTFNELLLSGLTGAKSLTVFTATQLALIPPEYPFLAQESPQDRGFRQLSPLAKGRARLMGFRELEWPFYRSPVA